MESVPEADALLQQAWEARKRARLTEAGNLEAQARQILRQVGIGIHDVMVYVMEFKEQAGRRELGLRAAAIRLAYANPDGIREHLLPLLTAADKAKTEEGAKKLYEQYKKDHPDTKKQPRDFFEKPEGKKPKGEEPEKKEEAPEKPPKSEAKPTSKGRKQFKKLEKHHETFSQDIAAPKGLLRALTPLEQTGDALNQATNDLLSTAKSYIESGDKPDKKLFEKLYSKHEKAYQKFDDMLVKPGPQSPATYTSLYAPRLKGLQKTKKLVKKIQKALGHKGASDKKGEAMTLRGEIIRLAHGNPDLRPYLLPLLSKTEARPHDTD